MANPPIVIGPFDNVPAPGSPIRSDWPQEISQWAVDTQGVQDTNIAKVTADLLAQGEGLAVGMGNRLRFVFFAVSSTTSATGAVSFGFPAGAFDQAPWWVGADDFYIASGQPANWLKYKVDGTTLSATACQVQIATQANAPYANTPVGFKVMAIGRHA